MYVVHCKGIIYVKMQMLVDADTSLNHNQRNQRNEIDLLPWQCIVVRHNHYHGISRNNWGYTCDMFIVPHCNIQLVHAFITAQAFT